MKSKEFIPASKPRNFVVKHQKTAGAGAHRDKKKEQKQGYEKHKGKDVSEGISVVKSDYDLDQMVITLDIEGKRRQFTYWDYDEDFENAERKDVFDQLQEQPWFKGLDHPTKMEILDASYKAIRGEEPSEYKPTVDDEPLDINEGQKVDEPYMDKVISSLHKDALGVRPDHEFGREWMSSSFEEKQKIYYNLLSLLDSDMDEGIGGMIAGGVGQFIGNKIDPLAGEIMRAHGEIAGRKAEYTIRKYMHLLQKALKQQLDSGDNKDESIQEGSYTTEKQIKTRIRQIMYDRKLSGTESNAGELHRLKQQLKDIRSQQDVSEASDFGEPREILEDVLRVLEREVEWPLTDVMDPREVKQLLAPVVRAVNDKMMSMEEARDDDWGSMSHREFKRRELQHELGHEDDPDFERKLRQQQMDKDRGPWYISIDGKIYKQKGEPKVFDWKKGANNYALAILKNKPELQGKILITKNPADK